jgi:DNA polymerase-4
MNEQARKIAHLDMDAFFAAVEQLDEPSYRGKPVIVGGLGPRGVVSTASYEARKYGVGSAMPMAKARKLCPHGIYLTTRFSRYQEISLQVRKILSEYTPLVETVSIDEAFFDLTGSERVLGTAEEIVVTAKARVQEVTGLTCSVGLAPNRFLAKLASELEKPDGLVIIEEEHVQEILDPLPVRMIWGVGKVTERRLRSLGLSTIRDLRMAPLELLVREFGTGGRTLYQLARGEDTTPVRVSQEAKSISREVTFSQDIYQIEKIEGVIRRLAHEVAAQLRRENLLGKTVRIKVRFPDFQTITRQISLGVRTDSTHLIEAFALDLLQRRVPSEGRGVRLIGVGVGRLSKATARQLSLFDEEDAALDRTIDRLSAQYGTGIVSRGEREFTAEDAEHAERDSRIE